jgi:hypothetical protein
MSTDAGDGSPGAPTPPDPSGGETPAQRISSALERAAFGELVDYTALFDAVREYAAQLRAEGKSVTEVIKAVRRFGRPPQAGDVEGYRDLRALVVSRCIMEYYRAR